MDALIRFPLFLVFLTFLALSLAAWIGVLLRKKRRPLEEAEYHDLDLIVTSVLTLLALIIGFSFSMAIEHVL